MTESESNWSSPGRTLMVVILAALIGISMISSFLIFVAHQSTQAQIEQLVLQDARMEIEQEARKAANDIEHEIIDIQAVLLATTQDARLRDEQLAMQALESARLSLANYDASIAILDAEGVVLHSTDAQSLPTGSDVSSRRFFELISITNKPAASGIYAGENNEKLGLSIAVPVSRSQADDSFGGAIVAYTSLESIRNSFTSEVNLENAHLILVDLRGYVVYHSSDPLLVGKSFREVIEPGLATGQGDTFDGSLDLMMDGKSGILELEGRDGVKNVMAYEAVVNEGSPVFAAVLIAPFTNETFSSALDEAQDFTIIAIIFIAIVLSILIAAILIVNRRMTHTVNRQDERIHRQLLELQNAYGKLKEQDVMKDEFINIAAHELRTPVVPIILSAENLIESMPADNNVRIILRNAERITKLTNDILDVSRIESNAFRLQKEKVNVGKLVQEIIQDSALKIPHGRNLKIVFESSVPKNMEECNIDRARIIRVVQNILDNAVNFTESGTISVKLEPEGGSNIRVSITDTGRGIDPSVEGRLFTKFATKSERSDGTGLGLYISKAIVLAHGGKIGAHNNDRGATFWFTMPAP